MAFFLTVLVAAAGCGPSGGGTGDDLDAPCNDELGKPLKAKDVAAAFEAEGFTMHSLPRSFYCNPENVGGGSSAAVADVSNQRSVVDDEEIVDREGWITCFVSRDGGSGPHELYVDLNRGPDSPVFSGTKAVFDVANVDCTHYPPENDGKVWQQRALAAMKRLERQLAGG